MATGEQDIEVTCITQAWNAVSEIFDSISAVLRDLGNGIINISQRIWDSIVSAVVNIWRNFIFPFMVSGINISGYFLDKFLYGSPALRPYLHDGLMESDIPHGWRINLRNNDGWDIYENMGPFLDNTFGILGLGFGVLNFFNHVATSIYKNFINGTHLLGSNGVFGEQALVEDNRNIVLKSIFGALSAPIIAVPLIITNAFDGLAAITKNFFLSFGYNVARTFNLLGENGVMGERQTINDERGLPAQIIYGILSSPFVFVVSGITNIVDGVCAFTKNFCLSLGYNVARTFNLLGEDGVMGERQTIFDKRSLPAQIIYGILSSPFVLMASGVSNVLDGVFAFIKNLGLSIGYNVANTYNLLGEYGVMGERQTINDERGLPAQIIYGILSSPFVFVASGVTNVVDGVCAFFKNLGLSIGYNVAKTYNLLGEYGVMGERQTINDDRGLPAQIIYGILSSPFVAIVSGVTNSVDAIFTFTKNFFLSLGFNFTRTFHLLGEYGVMGKQDAVVDNRNLAAQIIYGILSFPLVGVFSTFTNIVDGVAAFARNFCLSFGYNVARTFNLLGEDGVMGERKSVEDTRGLPAQIIYGILSAPFVAVVSGVTNTVDIVCSSFKNVYLSFIYNVKRTFNLLGENGVMGPRQSVEDERGLPAQIIYGIISSPFVFVASAVTNAVDGICAFTKNFFLSFSYNVARTFNLLGEDGVMGKRTTVEDDRGLPAQIIYGILSSPFVVIASTVTNVIDGICAFTHNFFLSFGYNVARTFNLLGENGVMGERKTINDERGLPAQIIYGILSSPFVVIASSVTNIIDGTCSFIKNLGLSIGYNVARTFNLLGKNGVMGERNTINDERGLPAQIIYGILSSPFVAIASSVTNIVDGTCSFIKNLGLSIGYNIARTLNLLGENGVMGERKSINDERGLPAQIIYGFLSSPFVAIASGVTNLVDGFCTFTKNFFLSFGYNVARTFNLLGEDGVMGERQTIKDERSLPAQIIYGVLSAPFVAVTSAVTNAVDGACAFVNNLGLSFIRNTRPIFNLLGEYGVMGPKQEFQDDRSLPTKIAYGILTAPFVGIASAVTNAVDGVCAYFKNYKKTIKKPAIMTSAVLGASLLAVPTFIARKTLKGAYNALIRPIADSVNCKPFNYSRMLKGVANVFTLGGFSAVKKVFEACTGYSSRFGFPPKENTEESIGLVSNPFNEVQEKFREAINLASKGEFPTVSDGQGMFRPFMRVLFGMHHKLEEILKTLHNAYLEYVDEISQLNKDKTSVAYNMSSFFQSSKYKNAKAGIELRQGEESLVEKAETYLLPSLRASVESI